MDSPAPPKPHRPHPSVCPHSSGSPLPPIVLTTIRSQHPHPTLPTTCFLLLYSLRQKLPPSHRPPITDAFQVFPQYHGPVLRCGSSTRSSHLESATNNHYKGTLVFQARLYFHWASYFFSAVCMISNTPPSPLHSAQPPPPPPAPSRSLDVATLLRGADDALLRHLILDLRQVHTGSRGIHKLAPLSPIFPLSRPPLAFRGRKPPEALPPPRRWQP